MAPVILALREMDSFEVRVLATAQHRQMLDQVLRIFDIQADIDLNIMRSNQDLTSLTARLLVKLEKVLTAESPQAVLAQGDTTTVLCMALASFYHQVPFGHVEAGLRTHNMYNPYPEEMNRVLAGRLTRWHFAPTRGSRTNLLQEGIPEHTVHVTGNTVIDALYSVAADNPDIGVDLDPDKRMILVTAHRRENFGLPLQNICKAILELAESHEDIQFLYPVHPNPNVREVVYDILGSHPRIILCPPLDYLPFVAAMHKSYLILSDSGGVQEEAPALGKPVLVLRETSERPEAIEAGCVQLVGHDYQTIVSRTSQLLQDQAAYQEMAIGVSPYGDGLAAHRICQILFADLCE